MRIWCEWSGGKPQRWELLDYIPGQQFPYPVDGVFRNALEDIAGNLCAHVAHHPHDQDCRLYGRNRTVT